MEKTTKQKLIDKIHNVFKADVLEVKDPMNDGAVLEYLRKDYVLKLINEILIGDKVV